VEQDVEGQRNPNSPSCSRAASNVHHQYMPRPPSVYCYAEDNLFTNSSHLCNIYVRHF